MRENKISPRTKIGKDTTIGMYTVIGYPEKEGNIVKIGQNCHIGNHVTIHSGARIMDNVTIQDYSYVEEDAIIGSNVSLAPFSYIGKGVSIGDSTIVLYKAEIHDNTIVGKHCRIGGFIAENTRIGDYVTVFGKLIHSFRDPTHWNGGEKSPIIDNYVVIGFDAMVIGDVKIGHHVYVAAGAIVTKDVPPFSIVHGINNIVPMNEWKGRIKKSKFWRWKE